MENIARLALVPLDAKRIDGITAGLKRQWRKILLEIALLAAFAFTTSLIARF